MSNTASIWCRVNFLLVRYFLLCSLSSAIHPLFCSIRNITPIISTVNRWVLIILWRFCEALILRASQGFFTCFRTRFSWFDHIFTTNSWKNIFVWFSYHILRQRLMVYTTAGTVSGRFILDISFSTWDLLYTCAIQHLGFYILIQSLAGILQFLC